MHAGIGDDVLTAEMHLEAVLQQGMAPQPNEPSRKGRRGRLPNANKKPKPPRVDRGEPIVFIEISIAESITTPATGSRLLQLSNNVNNTVAA